MIQIDEVGDKIKQFIIDKDLTSTKFADEIGVPRPSISHILSGRNKPSLEIVLKVIQRYPELRSLWFSEEPEFNPVREELFVDNKRFSDDFKMPNNSRELNARNIVAPNPKYSNLNSAMIDSLPIDQNKHIEHIVVFYTDKTFTHFKPNS